MMMMLMIIMNCFCGMVDYKKTLILITSWEICQTLSPSWNSGTRQAGFVPAQNLSSHLVEWSCALVITNTPHHHDLTWKKHISSAFSTYNCQKFANLQFKLLFFCYAILFFVIFIYLNASYWYNSGVLFILYHIMLSFQLIHYYNKNIRNKLWNVERK